MTAGTTANSTMYVFANTTAQFLNRFENNGGGTMNLVKSGPATVTLRVEPRITFDASYASSGAVDTLGANSTGQAGVPGLVVGMSLAGAAMNVASGSVITQVNTGTRVTFSANATAATGTDADQTFRAPVTQVLGNQTLSTAAATVTVPTGTVVYPGMTVTAAAGSTGALAANTTVLSISGTTVTLSVAPTTAGAATLLFGTVAAQTGAAGPTLTAGVNTFNVAANTLGLNVGQPVTFSGGTATLPANTYITAYDQGTGLVTLSANITGTTSTATSQSFAALTERSVITSTTSASSTARVFSSLGMFVGQPILGPGIPAGTTVASIVDANTVTLSQNATATGVANAYFAATPAVGRRLARPPMPALPSPWPRPRKSPAWPPACMSKAWASRGIPSSVASAARPSTWWTPPRAPRSTPPPPMAPATSSSARRLLISTRTSPRPVRPRSIRLL
jgi:hypothetical protein